MPGSEGEEHNTGFNTGEGPPQGEPSPIPSFELARRVILGMIQAIGDGAELVGATVSEELTSFRLELEHRTVIVLLVSTGVLGISVGIMLFLKELIGNWPLTLLLVGGAHVAAGVWLSIYWRRARDAK
jgi:hypothetical protein